MTSLLFHDSFDFLARTRPHQLCIDDGVRALNYAEAATEVNRLANGLLSLGLKSGDRFGYLSKNRADMWLLYLAAARMGVVPVPLNYRLAAAEWRYILDDAEVLAVMVEADYVDAIEDIRGELPRIRNFIAIGAKPYMGWIDYGAWLAGQPTHAIETRVLPGDVFYQMYTSGTTGRPKGVIVTHANYAANLSQAMIMITRRPSVGQVALVVTPLYHAAAVWICAFCTNLGLSILLHRDFDASHVVDTLERRGVVFTFLVPAMIQACLTQVADVTSRDFSALGILMYGASPIAEDTLRRAINLFGCDVYQAYGMIEIAACLTLLGAEEHRRALAGRAGLLLSAGRAMSGTELRIVDSEDGEVGPGTVGEIVARGPQIVPGYWRQAKATADFLRGGWAHTGDAGMIDGNGCLYICGRIKDMVVSGGENIYPREIESVLFDHPSIIDAAVIGVPDETYGEALPRNASGKVLKTELRAPYWQGRGRSVG